MALIEFNLIVFIINVLLCVYCAIRYKEKIGWFSAIIGWSIAVMCQLEKCIELWT